MNEITVIILTFNEQQHIRRAIGSVQSFATRVVVVDSGSTDATVAFAASYGAEVWHHPWINHAVQFNWALDQLEGEPGWVLRLDADEIVTPELAAEIAKGLPDVAGIFLRRRISFMGRPILWGGLFPIQVMRLFRNGAGRCEVRWMDEHIVVPGPTASLDGELVDDNLNPLDWWVDKHNAYASREVVDLLLHTGSQMPARLNGSRSEVKRWLKHHVYGRLPGGLRAALYFLYRFVLRLGILDGPEGRRFHVLQGFWYRYLVDAKLAEVRRHMARTGTSQVQAIRDVLGIDLKAADIDTKEAA